MNELRPRQENGMGRPAVPVFSELYDGGEIVYEESAGLISSYPMARFVLIGLLVVAMLVSIFPAREHFSDPSAYQTTIQTLDEKKTNVTVMIAVAMGASTGITLIPDDTGTPIADKLADIAGGSRHRSWRALSREVPADHIWHGVVPDSHPRRLLGDDRVARAF